MTQPEKIGEGAGATVGAVLCFVSWQNIMDAVVMTFIGGLIGGTVGFFVTRFWNWLFKRKNNSSS